MRKAPTKSPRSSSSRPSGTRSECRLDSYSQGTSAVPLLGETISQNLPRTVRAHGSRDALVVRHQGYEATYAELWQQVQECARGLIALGIPKGDRVGIWSPNRYEWVVVQYATARIGAILVNINPAYRAHELEYTLRQSGCHVLIIAPPFKTTDYAGLLLELCPEMVRCEPGLLRVDRLPDLRTV